MPEPEYEMVEESEMESEEIFESLFGRCHVDTNPYDHNRVELFCLGHSLKEEEEGGRVFRAGYTGLGMAVKNLKQYSVIESGNIHVGGTDIVVDNGSVGHDTLDLSFLFAILFPVILIRIMGKRF